MKDENNHEPTVQARQHQSGSGSVPLHGRSHYHSNMHMTPLEIGMYVLLAAFCFAIVVFVVSCVVYASKFKPHTMMSPADIPPGEYICFILITISGSELVQKCFECFGRQKKKHFRFVRLITEEL